MSSIPVHEEPDKPVVISKDFSVAGLLTIVQERFFYARKKQ
jgi:hypothetical protein